MKNCYRNLINLTSLNTVEVIDMVQESETHARDNVMLI